MRFSPGGFIPPEARPKERLPEGCYTISGPSGIYVVDLNDKTLHGPGWGIYDGRILGGRLELLWGPAWLMNWQARRHVRKSARAAWAAIRYVEEGQ